MTVPPFSRYGQGDQYMNWRQILLDSGYDPDVAPFPGLHYVPNGRVTLPVSAAATAAGRGPLLIDKTETTFNGTIDPAASIGYNWRAGGTVVAGEPAIAWVVEGDYNDGSSLNMEAYCSIFPADFPTHPEERPYGIKFNRVTRAYSNTLYGDTITLAQALSTGGVTMATFTYGASTLFGPAGSDLSLGLNSQTGRNATINVGVSGTQFALGTLSPTVFGLYHVGNSSGGIRITNISGASGVSFAVGVGESSAIGYFVNTTANGAFKGIIARGNATQSATLFEAQDSGSNPLWQVNAVGTMIATTASTAKPSIRLPHGTAPTSPTDGDMWSTTAGLFIRVNGVTKTVTLT